MKIRLQKTDFSRMWQTRLFGRDFMFGWINMAATAADADCPDCNGTGKVPAPPTPSAGDGVKKLGRLIREVREQHQETQAQLGEVLGKSHAAVSDIEKGKTDLTLVDLTKIASHYGVSGVDLIEAAYGPASPQLPTPCLGSTKNNLHLPHATPAFSCMTLTPSSAADAPMGVSQWREYGKKYGYWEFFEEQVAKAQDERFEAALGEYEHTSEADEAAAVINALRDDLRDEARERWYGGGKNERT